MEQNQPHEPQQPHKRRQRYRGTHPRTFQEKYKEMQPEKYAETIDKVIQKGSTPAGMHISICVQEILDILQIQPGQTGMDCTLGYGGHTLEMLKYLNGSGHMHAMDVDPIESVKTQARLERLGYGQDRLTIWHRNFAEIDQVAAEAGKFDFILADLGVSSMQIDNPDRGFSYKREGPLDLRLNPEKGISAAERLQDITRNELTGVLMENADEPYAEKIAKAVTEAQRRGQKIKTTTELRIIIENALSDLKGEEGREAVKKSCQRTFQALRIDVNSEFEVLEELLEKLPGVLNPGGRAAILTFHSGEDRLVKKSFQYYDKEGLYSEIAKDVIRPSAEECNRNPRARVAKLRWAVRV